MYVYCGTFNVHGQAPTQDLSEWLVDPIAVSPDVLSISLQEVSNFAEWCGTIQRMLSYNSFKLVASSNIAGTTVLLVFVKTERLAEVHNIVEKSINTTYVIWPIYGGKGAVFIAFGLGLSKLCFVGCHLSAHDGELERRNGEYAFIFDRIKEDCTDCDVLFWFGDLNYRLDAGDLLVRRYCSERGCWRPLFNFDQLSIERAKGIIFHHMQEPQITFRPTYKFDVGKDTYDTSQKSRRPAWTDRILFREISYDHIVQTSMYGSVSSITLSDHKPVLALFEVRSFQLGDDPLDRTVEMSKNLIIFEKVEFAQTYADSVMLENKSARTLDGSVRRYYTPACECLTVEPLNFTLKPQGICLIRFVFKIQESAASFLQSSRNYLERIVLQLENRSFHIDVQATIDGSLYGQHIESPALETIMSALETYTYLSNGQPAGEGSLAVDGPFREVRETGKISERSTTVEGYPNSVFHELITFLRCVPTPLIEPSAYKALIRFPRDPWNTLLNALSPHRCGILLQILGLLEAFPEVSCKHDLIDAMYQQYDETGSLKRRQIFEALISDTNKPDSNVKSLTPGNEEEEDVLVV